MQGIKYAGSLSDGGGFREYDQDAAFVYSGNAGNFALALAADGVGAYAKSGLASSYAAECLDAFSKEDAEDLLSEGFDVVRENLCRLVQTIHNDLVQTSSELGLIWGTTLTLLAVYRGAYFCIQIGDSRLYLSENGQTRQITEDHTVAERKRSQGRTDILAKDENTLTQCVGIGQIHPDCYEGTVEGPASFLLCSDGLSNTLLADEMEDVLSADLSGDEKLRTLDAMARDRGERDNIIGVLVEIG